MYFLKSVPFVRTVYHKWNTKTSNFQASSKQETNVFDQTAAREHWYDLWHPNLDGTHSVECKRSGCNDVRTAECTLFEITMMDGEGEAILTVCPVCGEMIVRGMEAPFDGVLYAFTAAYEVAGKLESFKGTVSVTLPLDAEKYTEFRLVRMDVPPGDGIHRVYGGLDGRCLCLRGRQSDL